MKKKISLLLLLLLFLVTGCAGWPGGVLPPTSSGDNQNPPQGQMSANPPDSPGGNQQPNPGSKTPEVAWPGSTIIRGDGGPFINVQEPQFWGKVASPIKVKGLARVFEATLQVRLKDEQGKILAEKTVTASEGAPGIGEYQTELSFGPGMAGKTGFVEVLTYSARDGSIDQLVSVPVEFK